MTLLEKIYNKCSNELHGRYELKMEDTGLEVLYAANISKYDLEYFDRVIMSPSFCNPLRLLEEFNSSKYKIIAKIRTIKTLQNKKQVIEITLSYAINDFFEVNFFHTTDSDKNCTPYLRMLEKRGYDFPSIKSEKKLNYKVIANAIALKVLEDYLYKVIFPIDCFEGKHLKKEVEEQFPYKTYIYEYADYKLNKQNYVELLAIDYEKLQELYNKKNLFKTRR